MEASSLRMLAPAVPFPHSPRFLRWPLPAVLGAWLLLGVWAQGADADADADPFPTRIRPLLDKYCFDCHGGGINKGGVTLDEFDGPAHRQDPRLWQRVLRNVRSGIMPPADELRPDPGEVDTLSEWIKRRVFELDPARPDPGRVTVRRLNRIEYRNTIRDLLGIDFDTALEFPADDSGHGFDNIGDVLTVSPLLLEKYLDAAQAIITQAVPTVDAEVAEVILPGSAFQTVTAAGVPLESPPGVVGDSAQTTEASRPPPAIVGTGVELSYYTRAAAVARHRTGVSGRYRVVFDLKAVERYVDDQFDTNQTRLRLKLEGETVLERVFSREGGKSFEFSFERDWSAGEHEIAVELEPEGPDRPQVRQLRLRLNGVAVQGPLAREHWVAPKAYTRFFPQAVPADRPARRRYASELLGRFAERAFRRPVDASTVDRLVTLAESTYQQSGVTFEAGIAQAMVAVLASPRFIFREEQVEPLRPGQSHPWVDEYALASRLSYFFWSTLPDETLVRLAREGQLRARLDEQVERLMADPRSAELIRHFTGQWLQARDIPTVVIDEFAVYLREHPPSEESRALRAKIRRLAAIPEAVRTAAETAELDQAIKQRNSGPRPVIPRLSTSLRQAMQEETEMLFAHVLREDRPLTELIDANYTFLNEELARHYGVPGVAGRAMRKVVLPPDSPRGGVLTQGTVLAVTSNPTRTSPVKRGVFVLEAILGTPPAPPPPNIPPLEDAVSPERLRQMTLRENLAAHASNPVCASCHLRMDPLGLALENFNAIGQWRGSDMGQVIDPAGKLITGEAFADVRELKRILATHHRHDFYHSVSEKLLTYALGRGTDYRDTDTLDHLAAALEEAGGRPSALIRGIVHSAPFQQRRRDDRPAAVATPSVPSTFATHFPAP
ncbi:MAG: DUF1592 domain-containing protein [Opitutaceae bacterium]